MTLLRSVPRLWRRYRGALIFVPVSLVLLGGSLVPAVENNGTSFGGMPDRPQDALAVVAIALECLPLMLCRRWPAACLVVVSLGFAIDQFGGYHTFAGNALTIAFVNAGYRLHRHRRLTVVLLSVAYVPFSAAFWFLGAGESPEGVVLFYLAMVLVWGLGSWLRSARATDAERRLRVAAETRAAERTRLAHELHDVVTHHVTAMMMQAEAARYLTATPERADAALSTITDTGRRAMTELRALLEELHPDDDPGDELPSTAELRALVEQTRKAGQPVEFAEEGTPATATAGAGGVAYRVVQEALTNALKYAHGSPTAVQVRHGDEEITVEVNTAGAGTPNGASRGSGRGLGALRERVGVLGGDFDAGASTGGGFYVRARIPAGSRV